MSEYIPFEIQEKIIKMLPVKSLIQFRTVSKGWKSLIDSSDFIAQYHTKLQHLLVRYVYDYPDDNETKYVSFVDDQTFPQHKVSLTAPLLVENSRIVGSAHGLVCFFGDYLSGPVSGTGRVVLWNPSIRKVVAVNVPNVEYGNGIYEPVVGFGVCRETFDPKIVKITYIIIEDAWQVEVFTLSTGVWRTPYSPNLPRITIHFEDYQVVIDGMLYWLATDVITVDGGLESYDLIISFDITSEGFKELTLPYTLANRYRSSLYLSKLRESLVVLESVVEDNQLVFGVWMMEDGAAKSFTKLYTINMGDSLIRVRGFRKSGEPIIQVVEDLLEGRGELVVYEPYSKRIGNLVVNGIDVSFFVYSYMETLLLLDQPDFTVYANGKRNIVKPTAKSRTLLKHTSEDSRAGAVVE